MNGGGITHLNTNAYRQTTHKKTPTDFKNQPNHQKTKQQKSMTLAEYVMSTSIMDVASIWSCTNEKQTEIFKNVVCFCLCFFFPVAAAYLNV